MNDLLNFKIDEDYKMYVNLCCIKYKGYSKSFCKYYGDSCLLSSMTHPYTYE